MLYVVVCGLSATKVLACLSFAQNLGIASCRHQNKNFSVGGTYVMVLYSVRALRTYLGTLKNPNER